VLCTTLIQEQQMKRIAYTVTLAAIAAFSSASAFAQPRSYEPAVPLGLPQQSIQPAGELATPAPVPPRLNQNRPRGDRDADVRHCLDRASNKAVHRCSLPYRPRVAQRGAALKTKAQAPAESAIRIEPSKPAQMKPGAPRPGDTAKAAELVKPMDVTKPGAGVSPPLNQSAKGPASKPPSGVPTPVTTPGQPAAKAGK
jgi:hypothetical protein